MSYFTLLFEVFDGPELMNLADLGGGSFSLFPGCGEYRGIHAVNNL